MSAMINTYILKGAIAIAGMGSFLLFVPPMKYDDSLRAVGKILLIYAGMLTAFSVLSIPSPS